MPESRSLLPERRNQRPNTTQQQSSSVSEEWLERPESAPQTQTTLNAQHIMQLQRTIGNQAVTRLLTKSRERSNADASPIQRAGDPAGLMKAHSTGGMTYHHIIPENKLHSLWDKLVANDHFSYLKSGLSSVVRKGYTQLRIAGIHNLRLALQTHAAEERSTWDNDAFLGQIYDAMLAGGDAVALVNQHFGDLESYPRGELAKSFRNLVKAASGDKVYSQSEVQSGLEAGDSDDDTFKVVHQMLAWMPGNIHVGPTKRLKPSDQNWDAAIDDGGDEFESAAKQVLSKTHYNFMVDANDLIDQYIKNSDPLVLPELARKLRKISEFNVTEYNKGNWRYDSVLDTYRLVNRDPNRKRNR